MITLNSAALLLLVLGLLLDYSCQSGYQGRTKAGHVSPGGAVKRAAAQSRRGTSLGEETLSTGAVLRRSRLRRRGRPRVQRMKRGWVWNQFFVLEEYMGSEPQYVGKLHSDMDHGQNAVKYTLSGEGAGSIFTIDQLTGDIHALVGLDREEHSFYTLKAQAVDI